MSGESGQRGNGSGRSVKLEAELVERKCLTISANQVLVTVFLALLGRLSVTHSVSGERLHYISCGCSCLCLFANRRCC